jgi:hypothetical protein
MAYMFLNRTNKTDTNRDFDGFGNLKPPRYNLCVHNIGQIILVPVISLSD